MVGAFIHRNRRRCWQSTPYRLSRSGDGRAGARKEMNTEMEMTNSMMSDAAVEVRAKDKLPSWNRPITDADRRAARAAIEAERAGDYGAIFRFIDTPRSAD